LRLFEKRRSESIVSTALKMAMPEEYDYLYKGAPRAPSSFLPFFCVRRCGRFKIEKLFSPSLPRGPCPATD
jgi:hypothetical protein